MDEITLEHVQHRQLFSRKSPYPYCVQEMGVHQWVKVTWSLLFLNSPSHEEDTKVNMR